ncbi:hypothetical protein EON80_06335, partial [bacterium]
MRLRRMGLLSVAPLLLSAVPLVSYSRADVPTPPAKLGPEACGIDVRPQDLPNGDYGGFYTWPELVGKVDGWMKDYPQIVSVQKLGTTIEGRAIPLLKISNNPKIDQEKPQLLYLVGIHPRE